LDLAGTVPAPDIQDDEVARPDQRLATLAQVLEESLLDGLTWGWQNEGHGNSSGGRVGLGVAWDSHFLFPCPQKACFAFRAAESRTVI
jgi:hypothetical protein